MSSTNGVGGSTPKNIDTNNQIAASEADKAEAEVETAAKATGNAAKHTFNAGKAKGKSVLESGKQGLQTAGNKVNGAYQSTTGAVSNQFSSWKTQLSDAYVAGKDESATKTFSRAASNPPTWGDKAKMTLKFPFTTTAYMTGHVLENPTHTKRESVNTRVNHSPSRFAVIGAAAAATWGAVLGLAGMAPAKLGFLIKPFPYAAGFSLVNLSAYAVYGCVAAIAVVMAIRVGVALVDKYKEHNASAAATNAAAPATEPAPAAGPTTGTQTEVAA